MKIALTGSDGMLGHDIQKVFSDEEVMPFTLNDFDITDLDATMSAVRQAKPDFLIHPAAYTDVDACEQNPETAYRVNGTGTRNLTMACEDVGCPIVYISTDYVFNGKAKQPYNEWDAVDPVNQYGLSKLMGERFVSSLTNKFYIVRTAWLYGKNGKNFVETMRRLFSEKDEISVVNDQYGSPTYTYDLAVKLKELVGKGYGTYHVTNSSDCTWYDFAVEIAKQTGSSTKINQVTSEEYKLPAPRPAYSVLGNTMMGLEGIGLSRHWKEGLEAYMKE